MNFFESLFCVCLHLHNIPSFCLNLHNLPKKQNFNKPYNFFLLLLLKYLCLLQSRPKSKKEKKTKNNNDGNIYIENYRTRAHTHTYYKYICLHVYQTKSKQFTRMRKKWTFYLRMNVVCEIGIFTCEIQKKSQIDLPWNLRRQYVIHFSFMIAKKNLPMYTHLHIHTEMN